MNINFNFKQRVKLAKVLLNTDLEDVFDLVKLSKENKDNPATPELNNIDPNEYNKMLNYYKALQQREEFKKWLRKRDLKIAARFLGTFGAIALGGGLWEYLRRKKHVTKIAKVLSSKDLNVEEPSNEKIRKKEKFRIKPENVEKAFSFFISSLPYIAMTIPQSYPLPRKHRSGRPLPRYLGAIPISW